jgi:hypothetical protein
MRKAGSVPVIASDSAPLPASVSAVMASDLAAVNLMMSPMAETRSMACSKLGAAAGEGVAVAGGD